MLSLLDCGMSRKTTFVFLFINASKALLAKAIFRDFPDYTFIS